MIEMTAEEVLAQPFEALHRWLNPMMMRRVKIDSNAGPTITVTLYDQTGQQYRATALSERPLEDALGAVIIDAEGLLP